MSLSRKLRFVLAFLGANGRGKSGTLQALTPGYAEAH